jgi:sulfite exporter TauE/SafE
MRESLLLTALLMGLAGGPHCLLMCGPTCVGLSQMMRPMSVKSRWGTGLLMFHVGRMLGYASLGAVMGASFKGLGWLANHSAVFQPAWSLVHVAAGVMGLMLFIKAEEPTWLTDQTQVLWRRLSNASRASRASPDFEPKIEPDKHWGPKGLLALGLVWTFLPCGLLYSALGVAALSSNAWDGGLVMLAFAVGSTLVLAWGPWIWRMFRLQGQHHTLARLKPQLLNTLQVQTWGMRLAGLSLAILSTVSLWQALFNNQAPWCITPV